MRACLAAISMAALCAGHIAARPQSATSAGGLHFQLKGRGSSLVLIHAFQMDLREWDDVVAKVKSGEGRVLRYDVRGHGRSKILEPLPSAVADLRSLLDELGIARATLVGSSMGCTIAIDFALTYPERVERLVLLSPGVPGINANAGFEWMKPIIAAVKEGDSQRAAELWWESPLLTGIRNRPDSPRYRRQVLDNAQVWTIARPPPPLQPPAGARLKDVAVPVLTAAGELDRLGSVENARAVAAGVRQGRYAGIAGAGHMLAIERPEEAARMILQRF